MTAAPSVTVVVPTADRPAQLARCLDALCRLDHPRERLEVVVVDDDGRPPVRVQHPGVRIVRRDARGGPGAARNMGAAAAEGDVLAFTDDDCLPHPGWLRELCAAVAPGVAAGGRTVNALAGNRFSAASQHIVDLVYAHYNREPDAARFFASNNLALLREDFAAVGGFDTSFSFASEDRDFCDRWRGAGNTLRFVPGGVVAHAHELDLAGFLAQHFAYGRGAAHYHAARRRRGRASLRDELPFHFDRTLYGRTLALRPVSRAALTVALLSLWQAANAAGYVLERRRVP